MSFLGVKGNAGMIGGMLKRRSVQGGLALTQGVLFWGLSATVGAAGTMSLPGNFAVSPTGAATYSIPLAMPPGTAGMTPTLSLEYNSQSSNGLLGMGWSLSGLPAITRCSRTWAQDGIASGINFDANDRFCLDGQRLVATSGGYGANGTQYRTEIDSFSKITSYGATGSGPTWFEVRTKSGQVMEFGNTTDSRILAVGKPSASVWAVNKVRDAKANYYTVSYTNTASNGQFYPTQIAYTGNASAGLSPYNYVNFSYQTRPDTFQQFRSGSLASTTMRLTNIKTYAGALVTDYRLTYTQSGQGKRSVITSVSACDAGGACLPSTNVSWTSGALSSSELAGTFATSKLWYAHFGAGSAAGGWNDDNKAPRMLVDVNGDGLPDVVGFGVNGVAVSLNTGTSFRTVELWLNAFGIYSTAGGWTDNSKTPRMLVDVNGDGLPDVVGFAPDGVYVALNTGVTGPARSDPTLGGVVAGFRSPTRWIADYGTNQGYQNTNRNPRMLADVNGDGLPDIVGFGDAGVYVSLNTGTSFSPAKLWNTSWGAGSAAGGWNDDNKAPRMLVDVNGDGLPDIVGFGVNGVAVSLNTGTSFKTVELWLNAFGIYPTAGGWTDNSKNPRMLADVNGDGLPDIVGFAPDSVYVALNTGVTGPARSDPTLGGVVAGFSSPTNWRPGDYGSMSISGYWTNQNVHPRMMADVNGDGLPDVVGFGGTGPSYSTSDGKSSFVGPNGFIGGLITAGCFCNAGGWTDNNKYPRMLADVNGDGLLDIVGFGDAGVYVSLNTSKAPMDFVSSITSGLGVTTKFTYVAATDASVVQQGTGAAFPSIDMLLPIYVVSRMDSGNGLGGNYSSTYVYSGPRVHVGGRGFIGFAQTAVTDQQTGISEITNYRQDFPYTGLVASTARAVLTLKPAGRGVGGLFSIPFGVTTLGQITNTYEMALNNSTTITADKYGIRGAPIQVMLTKTVSSGADLNGSALPTVTTTTSYDAYNNATQVVVSTPDGCKKTSNNTYTNDTTNWILGRLTRATVNNYSP